MTKNDKGLPETHAPSATEEIVPEPEIAGKMATERATPAAEPVETPQGDEMARILHERARTLARVPPARETREIIRAVTFTLGSESYAVEVGCVDGIYPLEDVTPVPCTPDFVVGVINLRGRILSVLDLHRFLGMEMAIAGDDAQVIAVNIAGLEAGILVDRVHAVRTLRRDELQPTLPTTARIAAEYTRGVTPDMLVLLDLDALTDDERIVVRQEVG